MLANLNPDAPPFFINLNIFALFRIFFEKIVERLQRLAEPAWMRVFAAQAYQPLQLQQVSEFVLRQFRNELLALPTSQLPLLDFQEPANFLAGKGPARFALSRVWDGARGLAAQQLAPADDTIVPLKYVLSPYIQLVDRRTDLSHTKKVRYYGTE